MLLLPSLLVVFSIISLGSGQFVYNYEEDDPNGYQTSRNESPTQYDSVRTMNKEAEPGNKKLRNTQEESVSYGTQQSARRGTVSSVEYDQEPQIARNAHRPRRRKYRRILREGEYIQPPQPPVIYSPSAFENIKLGEAPTGVYIPQDSLLNILKNPNKERPNYQHQSYPQYTTNYQSINFQNSEPQYRFFGQTPSNEEKISQDLSLAVVQPNVRYVSSSPESTSSQYGNNENIMNGKPMRTNRQRQRSRTGVLSEPEVDIDALRTPPDVMPREVQVQTSFQARPESQPRSVSRNSRRQSRIQNYWESNQPQKVYSPSEFQNIGLGEAPRGVHIPGDSILNILRKASRSQSSPVNTDADEQLSPQVSSETHMTQHNNFPPVISNPLESPFNPRRQLWQRERSPRKSRRNFERRSQYNFDNEKSAADYTTPAYSQEPRRSSNNSVVNRRQRVNQEQLPRRRDEHLQSKHSEASSSRQQKSFKQAKLAIAALPEDTDDDGIPGEAAVDYPTYHTIPKTPFSCTQQQHSGYYADLETSCQVVHLCQAGGVKSSFLCPNGTIFNQEKFSCQWWYKVNCADAPKFYAINDNLYKTPEDKKSSK
ncbi:chitin-binding type-2 domain-containing protein [Trichonephila inaurata madagascariensis]|uniref:Chitin-binding type-2 domain-containing protein n=1 Tax=Trichonephila inaurata madagascariensis TaxID=2747483 RepID=A0A8X6YVZ2_9ARAC|nr:chitin-binding type-2 domain-containing protein [Trichonephila inaurata madagascariensis]